jgi:SPOR domain
MRDTVAKRRPLIDLEQFERRLRQPSSANRGEEDPLAELARLVGGQEDPYKAVFEPKAHAFAANQSESDNHGADAWRGVTPNDLNAQERQISAHYPSIEAGALAGGRQPTAREDDVDAYAADDSQPEGWRYQDEADYAPVSGYVVEQRSRRPLYIMAAIILAGVGGIGASFALKGGSSSRDVATIKAADGPVKVQPETTAGSDALNQDASILDRTPQSAPVAVADSAEQPVDLSQMPDRAPRVIAMNGAASGAANVPVPHAQVSDELSIAGLIEPKKVKTVSVRPDGTVVDGDRPPQTAEAASRVVQAAKVATPKSTTRVANTPKPAAAVSTKPAQVADAQAEPAQAATAPTGGGDYAAQMAAPDSEHEALEIQMRLIKKYKAMIPGFHPSIRKAVHGDKTVYRVRTIGLSKEEATSLCHKVQSAGGACFVAKN